MSISNEVYEAGKEISGAQPGGLPDAINRALNRFLGDHFRSAPGNFIDSTGRRSERFACVVYRVGQDAGSIGPETFPADATAAVLDVCEELTLESLRASCHRIAHAKSLRKSPVLPARQPRSNITLGIVFAARTDVPLETLGEELERINRDIPSVQWSDMIVVATTSVINYAVQFPGESVSGDFLPPAEGALANYIPAIYIVPVMHPTGAYSFNKMLAFLIGHLVFFAPEYQFSEWQKILEGVSQNVVTLNGYQYNLQGALVPVPPDRYNERIMPEAPILIEDHRGRPLAAIKYIPWQSGGAVTLNGKLPLQGLLVFAGKEVLRKAGSVVRPHGTISHVLPMTRADFDAMLDRFQRQSNMRVRRDAGFIVQKIADEGASSPFIARIFIGVMRLRDGVYPDPSRRERFDKLYEYLTSALSNVRNSCKKIDELRVGHARQVSAGDIVRHQGPHIQITESIDGTLRTEVETFLNAAARALKTGMQNLGKELGVDIGFLFQQQGTFEKKVSELMKTDIALSMYLRRTRLWSEPVMKARIDLEHGTWVLPRVVYQPSGLGVTAVEPVIAGKPISEFVKFSFDRLTCFVEEFTCHCLQPRLPVGVTITEVPLAARTAEMPERFRITLAAGGQPIWVIAYHTSTFDDT